MDKIVEHSEKLGLSSAIIEPFRDKSYGPLKKNLKKNN